MAVTPMSDNLNIISALSDRPNATDGLTAAQLKAKYDEGPGKIKTYINNTIVPAIDAAQLAQYNKLINGNFDVAQRGTSFVNPTSGQFTLDHWLITYGLDGGIAPNLTHSKQSYSSGEVQGSSYFYRVQYDGPGSAFGVNASYSIRQKVENGTRLLCGNGKKVTIQFRARTQVGGKRLAVYAVQRYGSGGSPSAAEVLVGKVVSLTGNMDLYTATFTTNTLSGKTFGTNNDDVLEFVYLYIWSSGSYSNFNATTPETFGAAGFTDIGTAQVNAGDQALPFQPRSFAEELAMCQRYFEKSYDIGVAPATNSSTGSIVWTARATDALDVIPIQFKTAKRIAPTVTIYNPVTGSTGQARNASTAGSVTVAANNTGTSGTQIGVTASTTAGNIYLMHYTADSEL